MKKNRPMIISLAAVKGGAGKTTLAANIACGLAKRNYKVLPIDADSQESLYDCLEHEKEMGEYFFPIKMTTLPDNFEMLKRTVYQGNIQLDNYNIIVVDTPGKIDSQFTSAVKLSDLILIPVQPSVKDLYSLAWTIKLINQGKSIHNKSLNAAFVINRAKANTKISKEIEEPLKDYKYPILETKIHDHTVYGKSSSVLSDPKSKAAIEMNFLIDEIIKEYFGENVYA